jgi:hypothetical protein
MEYNNSVPPITITRTKLSKGLKLKQSHYTPRRHLGEERRYSSYSFLISALDGGEWSASLPGRSLAPGKGLQYPLYRTLGGPQSRPVWRQRLEEIFFRHCRGSNLDRPVVQPVAWHYNDWATQLTKKDLLL